MALVAIALAWTPRAHGSDSQSEAALITRALAQASSDDVISWDWPRWRDSLSALYTQRKSMPLWFSQGQLTRSGAALLAELPGLERRGLVVADYDGARLELARLATLPREERQEQLARLDVILSATAARLASDLHRGRVDPARVGYDLDVGGRVFDIASAVTALATTTDVAATLDSLEPRFRQYASLKTVLARYLELARDPQLTQLPALPRRSLRPGDEYAGTAPLRRLLAAVGDLPATEPATETPITLDEPLVAALRRFQTRHGLDADGILGPATFRALRTPLSLRAHQIALSLERIRWLPPRLDSPRIFVNVPQFRLFALHGQENASRDMLQMDVIVGEAFEGRRTPVFAADMHYVVLNPYWDVPHSILLGELLPEIRADFRWVARNGYEIVQGPGDDARVMPVTSENVRLLTTRKLRLRQKPGPANALGRVKFIFPNRHNVYMHDTPAPELFARSSRAYSHGCIRLAEPMRLLAHVLRDQPEWDPARIEAALQELKPVKIPLTEPIRVFILYGTALTIEAGSTLFFEDIYEQDGRLTWLLNARRPRTPSQP